MNPLVLIKPINMTPEQSDQVMQNEMPSLEDAIIIFNGTNTDVEVCDILVWKSGDGYTTYASTDGLPLPPGPPEE